MSGKSASQRRYARVINRFRSGVVGRDFQRFRKCVLTTRVGDDNGWLKLRGDLAKLVKQLRYKGVWVEYLVCPHITAAGMLHLDGILWLKSGAVSMEEVQVLWSNIHGSVEVQFSPVLKLLGSSKYIVSHMEKDYDRVVDAGFKGRLLMSQGWLPEGALYVRKMLVRAAVDKELWLGAGVWDLVELSYERWLRYEVITIRNEENVVVRVQRKSENGGELK